MRLSLVVLLLLACGAPPMLSPPDGGSSGGSGGSAGGSAGGAAGGSAGGTAGGAAGGTAGGSAGGTAGGSAGGSAMTTDCSAGCRYIRSGATGAGLSWSDALPQLPATLQRGFTYFVATGTYPAYTFDDAASGSTRIRIARATASDHGTDTGWLAAYAQGEARFGPLRFQTAAFDFQGAGTTRVVGTFQSTVATIDGNAVTLDGVELDGAFAKTSGTHTAGACTLLEVGGNDVTVSRSVMHDAADDGAVFGGTARLKFLGNTIHTLHGCGTDGNCGPCYNGHSDGIELYDVTDSTLDGNFVHHVASTAAVFFGNWADELGSGPSEYCENVTLSNNVFYSPDTGFAVYLEDARGLRLHHNTIWGLRQGAYGGLAIGTNVTDLLMQNNVILSINYAHLGASYSATQHKGDYNFFGVSLGQYTSQSHDKVGADPGFTAIPGMNGPEVSAPSVGDFKPKATSPLKGAGTASTVNKDLFGTTRSATPTVGAIE